MVKVETPVADPVGSKYYESQEVTLTCSTSGASIYYTTDGSEPDAGSTLYTTPIYIIKTTILNAIGIKAGYTNSDIMSETYRMYKKVNTEVIGVIEDNQIVGVINDNELTGEMEC